MFGKLSYSRPDGTPSDITGVHGTPNKLIEG
jgi:hypothetical protein